MSRRIIGRLLRMPRRELAFRAAGAVRIAAQKAHDRVQRPRWHRRDLAARLATPTLDLAEARAQLLAGRWLDAHAALTRHFAARPPRFVIHPSARAALVSRLLGDDPERANRAHGQAARVAAGWYDLLGYEGLRFGAGAGIDWHLDPVSGRRAPEVFWSDVPYLDPAIGDHKVIWELNRHQEWLLLGRGWWLARDDRFEHAFLAQLSSWMAANPPGVGINWASSLELALRTISWLWALEFFVEPGRAADTPWAVDLLLGIDGQLRHVERHLSQYFSPNTHLLGEALALYVAGRALPELTRATRWAGLGRRILLDQAMRQVLPDGVHAERSPHYHRYALDFYLLALTVARVSGDAATADRLVPVARGMAAFMRDITDAAGRHPQIGDDDGGELAPVAGRTCGDARVTLAWAAALLEEPGLAPGPAPEAVAWLTAALDPAPRAADATRPSTAAVRTSAAYPAAGYFISRHGASHLVFDAGRHGFMNGGHAHADALAVTLAAAGRPLLVDAGTPTYTMDAALRDRFRESEAHNTLTIDGRSQSIPAGPFHWAATADAAASRIAHNPRFDYFEGACDAYLPLRHERMVLSLDDDRWVIVDRLSGEGQHEAALHWHIDPAWQASADGRGGVSLAHPAGARARLTIVGAPIDILRGDAAPGLGWVSPLYGRREAAATLRSRVIRRTPFALATIIDASGCAPVVTAGFAEVLSERPGDPAVAVAVARADGTELTLFGSAEPEMRTVVLDARHGTSVTTDARMLHARVDPAGRLVRLCAVDWTVARFDGRNALTLTADAPVADVDVSLPPLGEPIVWSARGGEGIAIETDPGIVVPAPDEGADHRFAARGRP